MRVCTEVAAFAPQLQMDPLTEIQVDPLTEAAGLGPQLWMEVLRVQVHSPLAQTEAAVVRSPAARTEAAVVHSPATQTEASTEAAVEDGGCQTGGCQTFTGGRPPSMGMPAEKHLAKSNSQRPSSLFLMRAGGE